MCLLLPSWKGRKAMNDTFGEPEGIETSLDQREPSTNKRKKKNTVYVQSPQTEADDVLGYVRSQDICCSGRRGNVDLVRLEVHLEFLHRQCIANAPRLFRGFGFCLQAIGRQRESIARSFAHHFVDKLNLSAQPA